MGAIGNTLIKGIDTQEVINKLDSFYAYEMLAMHFNLAVHNRLEGQAAIVLDEMLTEKAEESLGHAKKLAERIAQIGGAVTGDPSRFVDVSPIERFSLPPSNSDVGAILSYILEQVRLGIRAYSEFLDGIREKDAVTYFEVLEVLKSHIKNEADIVAVLMKGVGSTSVGPAMTKEEGCAFLFRLP